MVSQARAPFAHTASPASSSRRRSTRPAAVAQRSPPRHSFDGRVSASGSHTSSAGASTRETRTRHSAAAAAAPAAPRFARAGATVRPSCLKSRVLNVFRGRLI